MSRQTWSELVSWATTSGTPVGNSAVEASIYPNVTIPANLLQDGRALRLTMKGSYISATNAGLSFRVRWGGVAGTILGVAVLTCAATANTAGALFELEAILQTRSNGSSGVLLLAGSATLHNTASPQVGVVTGAPGICMLSTPSSAAPTPVTVDLTADTALAVTAQWQSANAASTLTGMQYLVEVLN